MQERTIKTKFLRSLAVTALSAAIIVGASFALPSFLKSGDAYNFTDYTNKLVSTEDLYNSTTGGFNATPYSKLSEAILGTGKTPKDLVDAALAAGTAGQATQSEVTVKIGGLNWIPTYLSQSISGKPVLTLWLAGTDTGTYPTAYGQQVVDTNGAFSPFSTGWNPSIVNATWSMPANMYGSSYIRAVTLNNGGNFVTDIPTSDGQGGQMANPAYVGYFTYPTAESAISVINWDAQAAAATNNKFYQFTHGAIANHIITPADIEWQKNQKNSVTQVQQTNGNYWNNFNDSWDNVDSYTTFIHYGAGTYHADYQPKQYYGQWKDDKVWLPSYVEVGNGDGATANGLWKTSINQRKTGTGTRGYAQWLVTSNNTYYVGYQSYLRTAEFEFSIYNNAHGSLIMVIDENGTLKPVCTQTYGVLNIFYTRPAIHLELEYAQAEDTTVEYSGNNWATDTVLAAGNFYNTTDKIDWFDPYVSTVQFFGDAARTNPLTDVYDVGTYYGTVTLNASEIAAGRTWSDGTTSPKNFKFTIKKKRIAMQAPLVDDDGNLQNGATISSTDSGIPYAHDNGKPTAPNFALEYRSSGSGIWTTSKPSVAGTYFARPYITNPTTSNYEIDYNANDCTKQFTKNKQSIELPWFYNSSLSAGDIAGTVTTVEYDGTWQEFELINDATGKTLTGVTAGARSNGLQQGGSATKFKAREVGTYTLTVYLADAGANTRWKDYTNTASTRTITLVIKKKEITVTFDNDTLTTWQANQRTDVKVTASGAVNGEQPKLRAYYTKDGGAPQDVPASAFTYKGADIEILVDLSTFASNSKYRLSVELVTGEAVNNNYTISNQSPTNFEFFILNAVISNLDIEWQYTNPKTGTVAISAANVQVDFNDQDYTFGLNASKLPAGVSVTVTGDEVQRNVKANGGIYTVTATISANTGYDLDPSLVTVYTITYTIKPMLFDLSTLSWADDPEYNVSAVWMYLKDVPAGTIKQATGANLAPEYANYTPDGWITISAATPMQAGFTATNTATAVSTGGNSYTACYVLKSDQNHAFTWTGASAGNNTDGVTLQNQDTVAIVSHVWNIKPKRINTSSLDADWQTTIPYQDEFFHDYEVPTSNVKSAGSPYANILVEKYYRDINCSDEILDIANDVTATPGDIQYLYVKLTVHPDHAGNYELFDTMFGAVATNGIIKDFAVGDNRTGVTVTYGDSVYFYNGAPQGPTPSVTMQADITYTYYQLNADGSTTELSGLPTEVGRYRVDVKFDDASPNNAPNLALSYRLDPAKFVFEIQKLPLFTDAWTVGTGNAAPQEKVTASTPYMGGSDYSAFYECNIYEILADGTRSTQPADKASLKYDTNYVAVLTIRTGEEAHAEFDVAAQTEFPFMTGNDPAAVPTVVPDPVFVSTSLPYNGEVQTFGISNWDDIKGYVASITFDGVAITDIADIAKQQVGTYRLTLTLRTDENLTWKSFGSVPLDITLEIAVREVARPNLSGLVYTGKAISFFDVYPDLDWVEIEIVNFTPFVAGVTSKDDDGNYVLWRAGDYVIKFRLKDPDNMRWKGGASSVSYVTGVGYRVSPLDASTDEITLNVQIAKVTINGSWQDGKFVPDNAADEALYTVKYVDEDGNTVEYGEFEDGKTYRVVATIEGERANDYAFAEELQTEGNPAVAETEFSQSAGFFEQALGFLKQYWIWLVIAVCTLVFLILAIVLLAKHKKYPAVAEFEEELEEEVAEIEEEEAQEEEQDEPVSSPEPVAAQQNNANGVGDQSPANPYGAPAAPYGMPPYPPAYPYAQPAPAPTVVYATPAAAPAPAVSPVVTAAASVPVDSGAGSLGIGGLPLGMDTLQDSAPALGVLGLADEAALAEDPAKSLGVLGLADEAAIAQSQGNAARSLGSVGGTASAKSAAAALGAMGEIEDDELDEVEESAPKKKKRVVVQADSDDEEEYEEIVLPKRTSGVSAAELQSQIAAQQAATQAAQAAQQAAQAAERAAQQAATQAARQAAEQVARQAAAQQAAEQAAQQQAELQVQRLAAERAEAARQAAAQQAAEQAKQQAELQAQRLAAEQAEAARQAAELQARQQAVQMAQQQAELQAQQAQMAQMYAMQNGYMNPMMNGYANPMMNGFPAGSMYGMQNGYMNPMMNGMNPMAGGMGMQQPFIVPYPVNMGGSDDSDDEVEYVEEDYEPRRHHHRAPQQPSVQPIIITPTGEVVYDPNRKN